MECLKGFYRVEVALDLFMLLYFDEIWIALRVNLYPLMLLLQPSGDDNQNIAFESPFLLDFFTMHCLKYLTVACFNDVCCDIVSFLSSYSFRYQ